MHVPVGACPDYVYTSTGVSSVSASDLVGPYGHCYYFCIYPLAELTLETPVEVYKEERSHA